MSSQESSCWTCRFRKKGCDRKQPSCSKCTEFELTCHYNRPDWADGGARQSRKAQEIRTVVNHVSRKRREQRKARKTGIEAGQYTFSVVAAPGSAISDSQDIATNPIDPQSDTLSTRIVSTPLPNDPELASHWHHSANSSTEFDPLAFFGRQSTKPPQSSSQQRIWESELLMTYLDHVFPFAFPFYRPPMYSTSRAWILAFLKEEDTAVYHSILTISSFFFTVSVRYFTPGKTPLCKNMVWKKVTAQAEKSLIQIQTDLAAFNAHKGQATFLSKVRMMESIVHVLMVDSFLGRSTSWRSHLTPALKLLEEILEDGPQGETAYGAVFNRALDRLAWPEPAIVGVDPRLWNTDQAAFRFFTALLIFVDIVASTSLGQSPRLQKHYPSIIGDLPIDVIALPLDLFAFLGCENWVFLTLAEVASLSAWKNGRDMSGLISHSTLISRASELRKAINNGLEDLNSRRAETGQGAEYGVFLWASGSNTETDVGIPSRIWAYATRIYLEILVHGWSFRWNDTIENDIDTVLALLSRSKSTAKFHTFAWPICVVGCVSQRSPQRHALREMITNAGDAQLLSAVHESLRIMDAVWNKDGEEFTQDWDIMECLNILERPVLLV